MRGLWVLAAAVVMITSLVYAVIKSQPLKPSRIENGVLWLKGAGLSFLDSIDEDFPRKLL